MDRIAPSFDIETSAYARGFSAVCGVDEVGRGPLAGPVTAAAVILNPNDIPGGLADSKQLSPKKRAAIAKDIHAKARVSIAHASVAEIDRLNILSASLLAMERAVEGLGIADFALIDGNRAPRGLTIPAQTVVKGDARVLSIAAASIVAKLCRDEIMESLAQQFPDYGWDKNAGYPTQQHRSALEEHGVTPHHRTSFAPVHKILYQGNL
jgi:ribonuclease HII